MNSYIFDSVALPLILPYLVALVEIRPYGKLGVHQRENTVRHVSTNCEMTGVKLLYSIPPTEESDNVLLCCCSIKRHL